MAADLHTAAMARLPVVCIIGRPNTGKSTLFNAIVGHRHAIVSDVPGTTRDQVAIRVESDEMRFLLIDTAGMGGGSDDRELEEDVSRQSALALAHSDLILFTLDSREELTKSDHAVIELLRRTRKRHVPVIIVATKMDNDRNEESILADFHALGIADEVVATSGAHRRGIAELEAVIVDRLDALHFMRHKAEQDEGRAPRIAIVGKPNVGKSSIVNALMSEPQRQSSPRLVTPIPGTTRDASDTVVRHNEKEYVLVDTAGLRRQSRTDEGIESFASLRSIRAVSDADVAVLVLSAEESISRQEKRIASMAIEEGKALIIVLNKTDLLTAEVKKEKRMEIAATLPFAKFAPVLFCSATTREGLLQLFPTIDTVIANRLRRIPTRELHRWFEQIAARQPLGMTGTSKHITQADELPPTFVLFVKRPQDVKVTQLRTLENSLRSTFAFEGTPIRWVTK